MPRCSAYKPDGSPCERIVEASQSYCYSHDPARAAERQRNAARGGRGKASSEVRAVKGEIRAVIEGVRSGDLDRSAATVVLQGYRVLRDYLELERKVRETNDLAAEIEELRELYAADRREGGALW